MSAITPGLIIAIAAGGAVGAVLRFFVQHYSVALFGLTFPWGTLFVNVIGCGIIGLVSGYWTTSDFEISLELRGALVIGCLGAFTTFSAFSLDTMVLYQNGEMIKAALNVLATVTVCLIAVAVGSAMGSRIAG